MKKLLYVYLFVLLIGAIFAPFLAPFKPLEVQLESVLQPPSSVYWMGTDHIGRDVFSRVLYGARLSLIIGIAVMGITVFSVTGFVIRSGSFRMERWFHAVLMRKELALSETFLK